MQSAFDAAMSMMESMGTELPTDFATNSIDTGAEFFTINIPQGQGTTTTKTEVWMDGKLVHSDETTKEGELTPPSSASVAMNQGEPERRLPETSNMASVNHSGSGPQDHTEATEAELNPSKSDQLSREQGLPFPVEIPTAYGQAPALLQTPVGVGVRTAKNEIWVDGKLFHHEEIKRPGPGETEPESTQLGVEVSPLEPSHLRSVSQPVSSLLQEIPPSHHPGLSSLPTPALPLSTDLPPGFQPLPDWLKIPEIFEGTTQTTTKTEKWVDGKLVRSDETTVVHPAAPESAHSIAGAGPSPGRTSFAPLVTSTPKAVPKEPSVSLIKPEQQFSPDKSLFPESERIDSKLVLDEKQPERRAPRGFFPSDPSTFLIVTPLGSQASSFLRRGLPSKIKQPGVSILSGQDQAVPFMMPGIPPHPSIPSQPSLFPRQPTQDLEKEVDGKRIPKEEQLRATETPMRPGLDSQHGLPTVAMNQPSLTSSFPSQVSIKKTLSIPEGPRVPEEFKEELFTKTQVWIDGNLVHSEERQGGRLLSAPTTDVPAVSIQTQAPLVRPLTALSRASSQPASPNQQSSSRVASISRPEVNRPSVPLSGAASTTQRFSSVQGPRTPSSHPSLTPSVVQLLPDPQSAPTLVVGETLPAEQTEPVPMGSPPAGSTTVETYFRHSSGKEHVLIWKDNELMYSGSPIERGPSVQMPRFDEAGSLVRGSDEPFWLETYYKDQNDNTRVQVWKNGELVYDGDPKERGSLDQMPHFDSSSRGGGHSAFRDSTHKKKPHGRIPKRPAEDATSEQVGIIEAPSREVIFQHLGEQDHDSNPRFREMVQDRALRFKTTGKEPTIGESFMSGRGMTLKRMKSRTDVMKKGLSIVERGSLYEFEISDAIDQELQPWADYRPTSTLNMEFRVLQKVKIEGSRFSFGDGFSKSTVFASSRDLRPTSGDRLEYVSRPNVKAMETWGEVPDITINDTAWPMHALREYDQIYDNLLTATVLNPSVSVLCGEHVLLRRDHRQSMRQKVKIISGGRAGLEPLFTGYVGQGMLTAAVIGDLTEVPKVQAIYSTIVELSCEGDHSAGILVIVPNDFETRVVFGLALEQARQRNYVVEMVVVSDSVLRNRESKTKYETLSEAQWFPDDRVWMRFHEPLKIGIVLAFKLAGGMSENGKLLKEIEWAVKSLLVASASCLILDESRSAIKSNLYEAGRPRSTKSFPELISLLLNLITDPKKVNSLPLTPCNRFVVMVNCHDGNEMLLHAAVLQIVKCLQASGVEIERLYKGTFASGDVGVTVTLMKTFESGTLEYLDTPTEVRCWPKCDKETLNKRLNRRKSTYDLVPEIIPSIVDMAEFPEKPPKGPNFPEKVQYFLPYLLQTVTDELTRLEDEINKMDPKHIFGTAIAEGFRALCSRNSGPCDKGESHTEFRNAHRLFSQLALAAERATESSHAYLLSLVYNALSNSFLDYNEAYQVSYSMIGMSLIEAAQMVKIYARVKPRQPSMADSLLALGKLLNETDSAEDLDALIEKMEKLMIKTVEGSSRALPGKKHFKDKPEPGNYAVAAIVKSIGISRKRNWSIL